MTKPRRYHFLGLITVVVRKDDKMKCRFCQGDLSGPVVDTFFACSACQVHWNTEVPSKAVLQQSLTNMMLTACTNPVTRKCRLDQASEQLDLIKPHVTTGKLYDVGAAAGFVMHTAQFKGWEVYGNELSRQAVRWAKQHYSLDIFHGFLEDDPVAANNQFDLVVFWNTLEHVRNPIEEMTLATNILKPNGHIHIEVPIKNASELARFSPAGHMTEFDYKALDILRDMCGLEEVNKWQLEGGKGQRYARVLWRKPT